MITVRNAVESDIAQVMALAAANKHELGFILSPQYTTALAEESFFVACDGERIVGFVLFHHRHNEQTTLHSLCVDNLMRRQGIGNMLVAHTVLAAHKAGKKRVVLKAIETIEANLFYKAQGFALIANIAGRKSRMNIWALHWE